MIPVCNRPWGPQAATKRKDSNHHHDDAFSAADRDAFAEHCAWHDGYEAAAKSNAGYSAGYAAAERDIMVFLLSPEADGCDVVEAISRRLHKPQVSA